MKKIRMVAILLVILIIGSCIYVNFLKNSVEKMNTAVSEAYYCVDSEYTNIPEKLDTVKNELDKKGIVFCAFIDQKLIKDVEDELWIARELYNQRNKSGLKISLIRLNEKIDSLKDTEEFNLKKILRAEYKCICFAV